MIRKIYFTLLFLSIVQMVHSQVWSPWTTSSLGDTTKTVVATLTNSTGGDSLVATSYCFTLGQIIDQYSGNPLLSLGFCQGSTVRVPGNLDTLGLDYADDLKLRLFFTKNIFIKQAWQAENPDMYFELHQYNDDGGYEKKVYQRRFKQLEGIVAMKCSGTFEDGIPYYRTFSDSIDVILGPDQLRDMRLYAFAVGHADTLINMELADMKTIPYRKAIDFEIAGQNLHSIKLSWTDSSAYAESYNVFRDDVFIGKVNSGNIRDLSFEDRFDFDSEKSFRPGHSYQYRIIAQNALFPLFSASPVFEDDLSLTSLDIGLTSTLTGNNYHLSWDNSEMKEPEYDLLTILRDNKVILESGFLTDSFVDSLPIYGQTQDYCLRLSKKGDYLIEFKHISELLPPNGIASGMVLTKQRKLPVQSLTVTATTIMNGDTTRVSAQTDKFGNFEIQGIFYGRKSPVTLRVNQDTSHAVIMLSESQPVSGSTVLYVTEGSIKTENAPLITSLTSNPVDSINVVQVKYACNETANVLFQVFRNNKLLLITDQTAFTDLRGTPGVNYRYSIVPFKHLGNKEYLLGKTASSDVEFPKITVPKIILTADAGTGVVFISVQHYAQNLDGIKIFRDSVLWKVTGNTWTGADMMAEPGKVYEYSAQAFRSVGDSIATSGINRKMVKYPEIPVCTNLSSSSEDGFLELAWNFSGNEAEYNFDGFRIYRDSILIGFVLKGKHSYYDYHGIPGGSHLYTISSYLQVEDMIFESVKVSRTFMVPKLTAPHYISASKHEENNFNDEVIVTWDSDFRNTYDGFIIIRDGGINGRESFDIPSPYQETYIDMVNLTDINYRMGFFENLIKKGNAQVEYKLLAYADHNDIRYFSDTARAAYTFKLQDTSGVFAPVNFRASDQTSGNITLDWEYPEFMTSTFLLYRDSELISELPVGTRRFQDSDVEIGSRYIYHMRAVFEDDSSIFVADAGSISSGYLIHGKVIDRNYQPVVDVKLDLVIHYSDLLQYRDNALSDPSGYFVFPGLSLLDFTDIQLTASGVNSQFLINPFTINAGDWDGSHIYVEFIDATNYKVRQQADVARPVECYGKADGGSGTLFLTWGASNSNFSYFEISRGLRKIGTVQKGHPLILIDSSAAPGYTQIYFAQAFWKKADGSVSTSLQEPFIAEAPFLAPVENLEAIPFPEKNRVEISWSHPTNNVNGYFIYRNGELLDTCREVPFVFRDTTGMPNYRYTYGVTAYWQNSDGTGFESESTEKECKFPEVYDPTNLFLNQNNNSIEMTWVCDAENFDGFLIYRDGLLVNSVPYDQHYYRDFGGYSGKYHRFGVAAFREIDGKIMNSRIREKAYVFPKLVMIDGITKDSTDRSVTIGWIYGSAGDSLAKAADGFKVFRDGSTEPLFIVMASNQTDYTITDNSVDPETAYTYSIIAFKKHQLGNMQSPAASLDISTQKLHVPVNFIVQPNTAEGYYRLTWEYYDRLDIDGFYIEDLAAPDNNETLMNTDRIFIDTKGISGYYSIRAFKHGKSSNIVTYNSNTAINHTASYHIEASKGTSSRVKLSLNGLTESKTYYVKRDGELIASQIPADASVYVLYDNDVTPGRRYIYSLYDASNIRMTSVGWAKPNGIISGSVLTKETAGVPLVTITYVGKYFDTDTSYTYFADTTRTDKTGAFAFTGLTYGTSTEYLVQAFRSGHIFLEDTKSVILSEVQYQAGCDFTDTTAILLMGTVKHKDLSIGWEGVPVILKTIKSGGIQKYDTLMTNETGFFGFLIEPDRPDIMGYEVSVVSVTDNSNKVYSFIKDKVTFSTDSLRKFGAITTVDFIDTLTSELNIQVVTGGGSPIPKPFRLQLNSKAFKYGKMITSDMKGVKDLRLPALDYTIDLLGVENNEPDNELYGTYFRGKTEEIDLVPNKFIKADTCVFVYHTPAIIEIIYSTMGMPECIGNYVVKQDKYYVVDIGVTEIHGGEEVAVNSGKILIQNGASLKYLDTLEYTPYGRFESHYFMGGEPELIQPYRKYVHVRFMDEHGQKIGGLSFPVIVEGTKSLGGTDIFINPENYGDQATAHIPMYVLRDPPGDGSSSFLEKGITINRSLELNDEYAHHRGFETEGDASLFGVGGYWKADLRSEKREESSTNYEVSVSSTQRIETSSEALEGQGGKPLVGKQADVVIGMDMLFTYTIQYDLSIKECELVRTVKRTYKPTGIKSTWIYTRNQIEAMVREFSESRDKLVRDPSSTNSGSIESLKTLADNWQGVIDYIDVSGDPVAWVNSYRVRLEERKALLEEHADEATEASKVSNKSLKLYYNSLAVQLNQLIVEMDNLLDGLMPPEEGSQFSDARGLNWYTEAIQKINEFEEKDAIDFSEIYSYDANMKWFRKDYNFIEKIYEVSIKEADESYGDILSYPDPKNYTFGGGTSFESSTENIISKSNSFSQQLTTETSGGGGVLGEINFRKEWKLIGLEVNIFRLNLRIGGYAGNARSSSTTSSDGKDSVMTSGFTLSDNDPGDQFSVNVFPSLDPTQTAYFALVGGRSSCPEEEGTIFRDAPTLSVENPLGEDIVSNLLEGLDEQEEALFPLKIGSLNPFSENRNYVLSVNPASNRFNATIMANGKPLGEQTYSVSPYEPTFIDLSITRRPRIYEADSIEVTLSSACEGNISETVYLSAFWERPCTPVAITEPMDQWVSNRYSDEMLVKVTDFDPQCAVLSNLRLECRKGGSNRWIVIEEVSADSLRKFVHATSLIYAKPTFIFTWYVNDPEVNWEDGQYQLRVIADCNGLGGGQVYSNIVSGTIDRKNIRLAAPPEPISGVLTMGGKVKARFTEEVNGFEYRIITEQGILATGLEMVVDGQEIVLYGADNAWRNLHHGERFTVELRNVEDYWGNSTSNTRDSLISWNFRVWNAPVYVLRNQYDVSVPVNGTLKFDEVINKLISCESPYFGRTATFRMTSSTPASLSISSPQSILLPGYDSVHITIYGNRDVGVYNDSIVIDNLVIDGNSYADIIVDVTIRVVPELAPWQVDEGLFESTMNLVANFTLNGELSSDPLDMISVFMENEIRGLAHLEDAGTGNWAAYITAGERSGEDLEGLPLEFRIWDASEGKEYDGHPQANILFISNSTAGTSLDPVILNVDPVADLISYHPLHSGWNRIAFTPSSLNGNVNKVLGSLTPTRESVIKTLSGFATYTDDYGWLSADDDLEINALQGYMLYLTHDQNLRYPGGIHMQDTVVDIQKGWNLVGYPFGAPGNLADVLEISSPSTADLIKGETPEGLLQFSDYSNSSWTGSLTTLHPMYAYMLKSEGNGTGKLIWQAPGNKKSDPSYGLKSSAESNGSFNFNAFEKNMTVIGVVNLDGIESISSKDSLIVMKGDTVVGLCALRYRSEFNRYYASFMIYGSKNDDALDVYLYNYDRDNRYPVAKKVQFVENMALGSWDIPYSFSASISTGMENAVSSDLGLRAWIDNSEHVCKVEFFTDLYTDHQFGIYDILGREMITVEYHSHAGKNYLEIPMTNEKFCTGIYMLRSLRDNLKVVKLYLH